MSQGTLKEKLSQLPEQPGVYMYKDVQGKILYIGKASSLMSRVSSYFQKGGDETRPNVRVMMSKIRDLEIIVTDSEIEALILEANLVHEHQPKYNIRLKDDKHFPYVKVTVQEDFPRVEITRRVIKDGARYFGPYTDARAMRKSVLFLRKTFKIRECKEKSPLKKQKRLCFNSHINLCAGVCSGAMGKEAYGEKIAKVCDLLDGKSKAIAKQLRAAMQKAADRRQYEQASVLRDQLAAITKIIERQKMDDADMHLSRDVFAFAVSGNAGCVVVIRIREGLVIERQHFIVYLSDVESEDESIASFLRQYYSSQVNVPDELLLPVGLEDGGQIEGLLRKLKGSSVKILHPRRGEKVRLLELSKKNAEFLLSEELIRRQQLYGGIHPSLEALQKELGLPVLPRRIECFDISHIQGTDTVASMVTFVDAKSKPKFYRHYKITSVEGTDDFASMYEVVRRRATRLQQEGIALPDLMLIDGGKGQLSAAKKALRDAKAEKQPVAALAKRLDELFVPGHRESIMLARRSPALRLIQRIRDEAHRFAITYHRKLRAKRLVHSELNAISGVGPKKRELLLQTFGSVAKIKEASHTELSTVVGEKLASTIVGYFSIS